MYKEIAIRLLYYLKIRDITGNMSIYNDLLEEKLGRGERRVDDGPFVIMK